MQKTKHNNSTTTIKLIVYTIDCPQNEYQSIDIAKYQSINQHHPFFNN